MFKVEMTPTTAVFYAFNRGDCDAVGDGEVSIWTKGIEYCGNIYFIEFSHGMRASHEAKPAPLPASVGIIVGAGSTEQMVQINAFRIIAFVANAHLTRKRTIGRFPDFPVDQTGSSSDIEPSVSLPAEASLPLETSCVGIATGGNRKALRQRPIRRKLNFSQGRLHRAIAVRAVSGASNAARPAPYSTTPATVAIV